LEKAAHGIDYGEQSVNLTKRLVDSKKNNLY